MSVKIKLIESDVLEALSRMEDNSVHLVYLDPPWDTGNDFIHYEDESNCNYEELIYRVIQQSKRILKPEGNLFFYSIPALNVNFHNLIRPIFGEENFRAEFIIPIKGVNIRNKTFRHTHETLLCYSKSANSQFFPLVEKSKEEIESLFPLKDNRGNYRYDSLVILGERPNLNFQWRGFNPPKNYVWRHSKEKLNELESEGKIFYEGNMLLPKLKKYSHENSTTLLSSIWTDIAPFEKNEQGYIAQQSEKLITRVINISTKKGDVVCDPFSGSGTTAVVCDKTGRDWIGIEVNKEINKVFEKRLNQANTKYQFDKKFLDKPVVFDNYDAFGMSTNDIVKEIIQKGENERVEFKESYNYSHYQNNKDNTLPEKIMKEIAAFLNSKYGGSIFLGVKDNGEIVGLEKDYKVSVRKENQDGFELCLTNKIKESFGGYSVDGISLLFHSIHEKPICEIRVTPNSKPVFLQKEYYIRNGTQSTLLKNEEFYVLLNQRRKTR